MAKFKGSPNFIYQTATFSINWPNSGTYVTENPAEIAALKAIIPTTNLELIEDDGAVEVLPLEEKKVKRVMPNEYDPPADPDEEWVGVVASENKPDPKSKPLKATDVREHK